MDNKTEIKKALYKEKPIASYDCATKDGLKYRTGLKYLNGGTIVYFLIPFSDIGDAKFEPMMQSQLLIRWIIN